MVSCEYDFIVMLSLFQLRQLPLMDASVVDPDQLVSVVSGFRDRIWIQEGRTGPQKRKKNPVKHELNVLFGGEDSSMKYLYGGPRMNTYIID